MAEEERKNESLAGKIAGEVAEEAAEAASGAFGAEAFSVGSIDAVAESASEAAGSVTDVIAGLFS